MPESVLLVLADEHAGAAAQFVDAHHERGARLLRPLDLSSPGWSYRIGEPGASIAMVDGVRYPADCIRGVVTRLPCISGTQLPHVVPADRDYVAAEMSAFLLAWLSALSCPVLNRPQAPSLMGAGWRWEQWVRCAHGLGVPVVPLRREVRRDTPCSAAALPTLPPMTRVTLVGATPVGRGEPPLVGHARRLAAAAGASLLGLLFDGGRLAGVELWPDLADPAIAAAVLGELA